MATGTAEAKHAADRGPSDDEAAEAERQASELRESGELDKVGEHYQEMTELGVEQEGEGKIE